MIFYSPYEKTTLVLMMLVSCNATKTLRPAHTVG